MPFLKPQKSPRQRLGEAGLASLMRDPRYFDSRHPDHRPLNKLVQRGFQLVFDEPVTPEDNVRTGAPSRRRAQPFAEALRHLANDKTGDEGTDETGGDAALDELPPSAHERLGRRAVLGALKADGARFPPGFAKELAQSAPQRGEAGEEKPPQKARQKPKVDSNKECEQIRKVERDVIRELNSNREMEEKILEKIEGLNQIITGIRKEKLGKPSSNPNEGIIGIPHPKKPGDHLKLPKLPLGISRMWEKGKGERDHADDKKKRIRPIEKEIEKLELKLKPIRARIGRKDRLITAIFKDYPQCRSSSRRITSLK